MSRRSSERRSSLLAADGRGWSFRIAMSAFMAVISVVRVLIEAKTSAREGSLMVVGWFTEEWATAVV